MPRFIGYAQARRWLRSLRGKLIVASVLAAMVIGIVGFVVLSAVLRSTLATNVDVALQARLDTVQVQLATPSTLTQNLSQMSAGRGVTAVYSATGEVIAASTSQRLPRDWYDFADVTRWPSTVRVWTTHYTDDPFRAMARPVTVGSQRYLIAVGDSLAEADAAADEIQQVLAVVVPLLLILVGLGAWWISGAALRPVERMRADALAIGVRDTGARLTQPDTGDSISALAATFNQLLDRLHSSLAHQRQLVADAGHELRTPLAVLQLELETAVRPARTRDDLVDSITHAREEVARLTQLSENLLLLAQSDSGEVTVAPESIDVQAVVAESVRGFSQRISVDSLRVDSVHDGPPRASVDPQGLRRVLDNLLANAIRHTPRDGRITITTYVQHERLMLIVHDGGPGFPVDFLPIATHRFTRADSGRRRDSDHAGSGLGLSIVQALAQAHGGTVELSNDDGAVVTVTF